MDDEIKSIQKNKTWELADLHEGQKVVEVKCVYKTKKNAKGEIERPKARQVTDLQRKMNLFLLLIQKW